MTEHERDEEIAHRMVSRQNASDYQYERAVEDKERAIEKELDRKRHEWMADEDCAREARRLWLEWDADQDARMLDQTWES